MGPEEPGSDSRSPQRDSPAKLRKHQALPGITRRTPPSIKETGARVRRPHSTQALARLAPRLLRRRRLDRLVRCYAVCSLLADWL